MIPALGFPMQNYGKKQHKKFYEKKSGFVAYVKFANTLIINNIKRPPFQKKVDAI